MALELTSNVEKRLTFVIAGKFRPDLQKHHAHSVLVETQTSPLC